MHLQDTGQQRKLAHIPDYLIWSQCFAIFAAVFGMEQPHRIPCRANSLIINSRYSQVRKNTSGPSGLSLRHQLQTISGEYTWNLMVINRTRDIHTNASLTCQKTLMTFGASTANLWTTLRHSIQLCLHSRRPLERTRSQNLPTE